MQTRQTTTTRCLAWTALLLLIAPAAWASNFERTDSRSQFVHNIHLYDAQKRQIDPAAENPPPYSPANTCGKCHDYATISHGYHFNAALEGATPGRPGEPWIWTDARTGSQIPLSYRGWKGTFKPADLGITPETFTKTFGGFIPGGGAGTLFAKPEGENAKPAAPLVIDCLICHDNSHRFSFDTWNERVGKGDYEAASMESIGLGKATKTADGEKANYDLTKFDAEKRVFFDVIRKPTNNQCYQCHTVQRVGPNAGEDWTHDGDVHIKAGLMCVDCHRNGIAHDTVRGYKGEEDHAGVKVDSLTCMGCHQTGRLGSPKLVHKGLPPVHFDRIACTTCHAGPRPGDTAMAIKTAMAHQLGTMSQTRTDDDMPLIREPVFAKGDDGLIHPQRIVWPAFWGEMKDNRITPLDPDTAYGKLRSPLRVRKDFRAEVVAVKLSSKDRTEALGEERSKATDDQLTADEKAKLDKLTATKSVEQFNAALVKALGTLAKDAPDATPVYVSGGRAYKLSDDGKTIVSFDNEAANPYRWSFGHDVRPARQALGATGCMECHGPGKPIYYSTVAAVGPAPDPNPPTLVMHELQGQDAKLLAAWEQSFEARSKFKTIATVALGVVGVVLAAVLLSALSAMMRWWAPGRCRKDS
ncbi:MAG: hypothetical protein GC162_06330 [Planctomycetes bacterium]|nr:hypothetical protein [Planctomycetota bacterium]